MYLKDITNDEYLVYLIDELKHRIKPISSNNKGSEMGKDFNHLLDKFIDKWNLDCDQHHFAKLND